MQKSVRTLKGLGTPSVAFWWHLMHWRDYQVFPVSEVIYFSEKKTDFLINSGHKTAAEIDKFDESNDGVFLLFFLYWLTCDACWLLGGGLPFMLVPSLSGRVCAFEWYQFSGGERNICRDCVDELGGGGMYEKLKNLGYRNVSNTV